MKPLGVYDNSSDLHRAINLSDGYYGDWSSLVALYGATGKAIVIQDVNASDNDVLEPRRLMFADFVVDDDGSAWAFELFYDGLFKLDFVQHSAEFITNSGCFPNLNGKDINSHRYIYLLKNGSKIICFPYLLNRIMIYDTERRETEFIEIDLNYLTTNSTCSGFEINHVIEFNERYYAFGYQSRAIIVINKDGYLISYHTKLFREADLIAYNDKKERYPLYISEPSEDGWIKILLTDTNGFLNYNLISQKCEIIQTNIKIKNISLAEFSEGSLWLFDSHRKVLMKWNVRENIIDEYELQCDGFKTGIENIFSAICDCGEKLFLFPYLSNMVLSFDKKKHCFENFVDLPVSDKDTLAFKYDRPKKIGDKIFAFARYNSSIYEIDTKSGKISKHVFKFTENNIHKTMRTYKVPIDMRDSGTDGKAGKRIYGYTRSLILE